MKSAFSALLEFVVPLGSGFFAQWCLEKADCQGFKNQNQGTASSFNSSWNNTSPRFDSSSLVYFFIIVP